MNLPEPLLAGVLIKRYKRFLADIKLENGETVTALCPNTGSMKSCNIPGSKVMLSESDNPKRKLKFTWELIRVDETWVGINTGFPNKLVREGIEQGIIRELQDYPEIRGEIKYGQNSRIDLLLEKPGEKCYVEVKNVTLVENNVARFPDAVTVRGQKHLRELMQMVREGNRAVIFFLIQREDGHTFSPANDIDPVYGDLLREAVDSGVEALAYQAKTSPEKIIVEKKIPIKLIPPE